MPDKCREVLKDAAKLAKYYMDLKEILGGLQELADKYQVPALHQLLLDDIRALDAIDHDLIKIAYKMRKNEENKV